MKGDIEKNYSTKPKESIEVIEQKWDDITHKFQSLYLIPWMDEEKN